LIEKGAKVGVRLLYGGPLKAATQSNSRVKEKHAIRKELHKQFAELFILKSVDPKSQYLKNGCPT
jgi:hypothetical protein